MTLATKPFHSVNDIPHGSTLTIEAIDTVGNVQGNFIFLSGAAGVPDNEWTVQDAQNGNAQTLLAGPGISWVRAQLTLDQGSSVQISMTIDGPGMVKRNRAWNLDAPNANRVVFIGWIIAVLGG